MLLIGQAGGWQTRRALHTSIVEMFTTGMQECASTVKITKVEMQWKLNEKEAKIKTTKAKAKQLERHLKEKGNVLFEKEERIEVQDRIRWEQAELIKALQAKRT